MEKDKKKNEQFYIFSTLFSVQYESRNPLKATFQLSSAPSLNLGRSQNGVLENRLKQSLYK